MRTRRSGEDPCQPGTRTCAGPPVQLTSDSVHGASPLVQGHFGGAFQDHLLGGCSTHCDGLRLGGPRNKPRRNTECNGPSVGCDLGSDGDRRWTDELMFSITHTGSYKTQETLFGVRTCSTQQTRREDGNMKPKHTRC